ncbi:MAG: diguanylate cyclase [Clostridiales bacterium]|nr:diguanylate cyclase [Clostridiales bacterium]
MPEKMLDAIVPDGFLLLAYKDEWHVEQADEECLRLLKVTADEIADCANEKATITKWRSGSEKLSAALKKLLTESSRAACDVKVNRSEGRTRYVRLLLRRLSEAEDALRVYGVAIDVSDLVEGWKEEARIQEDQNAVALEQSGMAIHKYFIKNRRAILPASLTRRFGAPSVLENMPEWCVKNGIIHPSSLEDWNRFFDAIDRGEKNGTAEIMICRGQRVSRYRALFSSIANQHGIPVSAVVSYEDITEEYERNKLVTLDIHGLLQSTKKVFPELLTINLSKNSYRMIQYDSVTTRHTPQEGVMDDMIDRRLVGIAEEDREAFVQAFSRENLLRTFADEKKDTVQLVYRRINNDGHRFWFETIAMRQRNPFDGDVMAVAMSRNVDAQKAEEIRLQQEVYLKGEEIRLSMTRLGKTLNYYDIQARTLTIPPAFAVANGLPEDIPDFPECVQERFGQYLDDEAQRTLSEAFIRIANGDSTGAVEFQIRLRSGEVRWTRLEFANIYDAEGKARRAVISTDDVTDAHEQTLENRRLKENEQLFSMVAQHSDRELCYYDVVNRSLRPWNAENCERCSLAGICMNQNARQSAQNGTLMESNIGTITHMFADIHNGTPNGGCKVRVKSAKGEWLWYDFKFSTVYGKDGKPALALISHRDVTEEYEREMAYVRQMQALEEEIQNDLLVFECDLTEDLIQRQHGVLLADQDLAGENYTAFYARMLLSHFSGEARESASQYYSKDRLQAQYNEGRRHLEATWNLRFRSGEKRWIKSVVELINDPYSNHLKGIFRFVDINSEVLQQMEVQKRAEKDGLTGLLNRATCEERIAASIAVHSEEKAGGILILLDLDDLKGINDTFGHEQGDRAIRAVADTLKNHFRESDMIGRIGGDEYMIFLPKAAPHQEVIGQSLNMLLRKLSMISVGDEQEKQIHCSIGCAAEVVGQDDFESLYKRADLALYHVKRSGKNNFAFYQEQMEQANYQFRSKAMSLRDAKVFEWGELQRFLESLSIFYPLVISANLTLNSFYIMEAEETEVFSQYPTTGKFDLFTKNAKQYIHPDDVDGAETKLTRKALLKAYESGQSNVQRFLRHKDTQGAFSWLKYIVIFDTNPEGDVCAFILARWAREREQELDLLRLRKLSDLALTYAFEYVGLIDVASGRYNMYLSNKQYERTIPQTAIFDDLHALLRDHYIVPEEREQFARIAPLSTILEQLEKNDGTYSYEYTSTVGKRHVEYHWYEESHTELLMTVRKI